MNNRLVATAGHVDHGKTALLKQLTGTDADRLEEEQKRGLTIDIGFADLVRDNCHIGFIDVPGHHNFIKNMVSGVGSVQGVLFVVSATDGWQAQSREHFEIIHLLEPDFILFAITKIDRADDELILLAETEIEQAIEGTSYEGAPIKSVSSETGEGVDELTEILFNRAEQSPEPADHGQPYCPIDRVFSVKGQGTVVTGSLSGGDLETEDQILRQPENQSGRVRGLQQYHEDVDRARRSARVAVNVPDWDHDEVDRGDILTVPGSGRHASVVDARVEMSRFVSGQLDHDTQILAYAGTDRMEARVLTPDQEGLMAGETSFLRMTHLNGDGFYRPGDRVILRDFSDQHLLGCLTVLNLTPDRSLGDPNYRDWLAQRYPVTMETLLQTTLSDHPIRTPAELANGQRYSESEFKHLADDMDEVIRLNGDRFALESWWDQRITDCLQQVDDYHRQFPHRKGRPLSDCPEILRQLRDAFRDEVSHRGYTIEDELIRRDDFEPHLNEEGEGKFRSMTESLREDGLETPDREQLESRFGTEVVEYGIQQGDFIPLSEQRIVERTTYETIKQSIVDFMDGNDPKRLSELRDHLQSSRQYVIPLMEHLDREGLTVRDGDVRHLSHSH